MKNILRLLAYFLFISTFTFGCNGVKKKNDIRAEHTENDNEEITSTSQDEPQNISFKMKLWNQGIDFYARGNEPFWAVDIDLDKGIRFSNLDGLIIETTSLEIHEAADAKVIRISGVGDSWEIIVTIMEEECSDTMSDEKFRNSVKVEIKKEGEEEYAPYKGCGQYVPDYRIHDIWVLVEANGNKINSDRFPEKGSPTFEFYAEEGRVSGHAGCNNFNSTFYRTGKDILNFEPFAMTRMMCPDMELEDLIAQSVAGNRIKYEVKNLELTLTGYDGNVLTFRKID